MNQLKFSAVMMKLGVALAFVFVSLSANAFVITSQVTGDNRNGNPADLIIDVTINVTGNTASWLIDINSPAHPNIKLDEFYFNMAVDSADLTFNNFNLPSWTISSPASTVGGGNFGPGFHFETTDGTGSPANNPTNAIDLSFDMILSAGIFTEDDFLTAVVSSSSDVVLGSGQMGAHLQSLTVNSTTCPQGGCSDSGFALGMYVGDPGGPIVGNPVPAPATIALMLIGLLSLGVRKHLPKN